MTFRAPWLAHYDPGVPSTLAPYPDRTILDYVADFARMRPQGRALIFKGREVSYSDLEAASDAFAVALADLGVAQGHRVGLLLPNSPQFVIAELAAWKLGAIVAPLNPTYIDRELEGALRDTGVETIVTLTRFYTRVKGFQARTPLERVIATNIKEYFPLPLRIAFTLFREKRDGDRVRLAPGDHDFAHLLLINKGRTPARVPLTPDDPAILLMSGGTTGTPKGVLGKHGAYVLTGLQIGAWFKSALEARRDVVLATLPLFHVYANLGLQPMAFVAGSTLALVPNPRDLGDVLHTIRRVKPTFFPAVPTMFIALLNHAAVKNSKVDFKSIKSCFSGASALMADTKQRFEAL